MGLQTQNNNSNDSQALDKNANIHKASHGVIPSVRTNYDKFVELSHILFEYVCVALSVPVILIQGVMHTFRNWRGVNPAKLEKLSGKVVLITGANSGIGECVAKYFYLAGCKLILAARRRGELERVRDSLLQMESSSKVHVPIVLELDLSDSKSIASKAETAIAMHGKVDILINNAGIYMMGHVLDTVMDVDERVMSVNYLGTLALTKVIGRHMVQRKQGHIAFVSSVLGKMTITNGCSYSASKHAMQALADSLRAEVTPQGVNITIISPSFVNTAISVNALCSSGSQLGVTIKEIEEGYSPDYVCERIFKAVVNEEEDVTIAPLVHRGAIYLRNFIPSLFFVFIRIYGRRFKY